MLILAYPWLLTLLPLPWLVHLLLPPRRQESAALQVPFGDRIQAAADGGSTAQKVARSKGPFIFKTVLWLLLLFALARPQWLEPAVTREMPTRDLLRACRENNGNGAGKAWVSWRNTQIATFRPGPDLQNSVLALHRRLFGSGPDGPWQGEELATAFAKQLKADKQKTSREKVSILPELNG